MKKKVTIEELAGVLNMTTEGILKWTLANAKSINLSKRSDVNLEDLLLKIDSNNEISIEEFIRWSDFIVDNRIRGISFIETGLIKILKEGDEEIIKRLTDLNNERLRIEKERKKLLKKTR